MSAAGRIMAISGASAFAAAAAGYGAVKAKSKAATVAYSVLGFGLGAMALSGVGVLGLQRSVARSYGQMVASGVSSAVVGRWKA